MHIDQSLHLPAAVKPWWHLWINKLQEKQHRKQNLMLVSGSPLNDQTWGGYATAIQSLGPSPISMVCYLIHSACSMALWMVSLWNPSDLSQRPHKSTNQCLPDPDRKHLSNATSILLLKQGSAPREFEHSANVMTRSVKWGRWWTMYSPEKKKRAISTRSSMAFTKCLSWTHQGWYQTLEKKWNVMEVTALGKG